MIIYGAKAVLRYLRGKSVPMCRDTLYRLAKPRDRGRFPIEHRTEAFRVQVTADTDKIDAWILRNQHRQTKQTASGHGGDLRSMI